MNLLAGERLQEAYDTYNKAYDACESANQNLRRISHEVIEERRRQREERGKLEALPWGWTWLWFHSGGGSVGGKIAPWLVFYTNRLTGEVKGFYGHTTFDGDGLPETVASLDELTSLGWSGNAPADFGEA